MLFSRDRKASLVSRLRRSWGGVAIMACILAMVTACSSAHNGAGNASSNSMDNFVTTNGSEPAAELIPADTNEVGGSKIEDLIFSGLVSYTQEGKVQNEVAQSITSKNNTDFTIKLQHGWKFSDGTPVKAENFVRAWKVGAKQALRASSNYSLIKGTTASGTGDMTGAKAVDDYTIDIQLKQPDVEFATRLGHQSFYPLPDKAFTVDGKIAPSFGMHPIGNGMYKLENDHAWVHNQHITLVKNPYYKGKRQPRNKGIVIRFYSRIDAAYDDLISGNLDVLDKIPYSDLAKFRQDLGGRSVSRPTAWTQQIIIPEDLPHFGYNEEGRLRRAAISRAIDRSVIIKQIFSGTMTAAKDFTSSVLPGFNPHLKGADVLQFNVAQAKKLWAEANKISPYHGTFVIAYNSDDNHQAWINAVINQLKQHLGIKAAATAYPDFGSLRKAENAHKIHGALRFGYQAGRPTRINLLENLYVSNATANDAQYANPQFDKLLREAVATSSESERYHIVDQAQEILLRDLPAIPMWTQNAVGGWSTKVHHVAFDWHGFPVYWKITK